MQSHKVATLRYPASDEIVDIESYNFDEGGITFGSLMIYIECFTNVNRTLSLFL